MADYRPVLYHSQLSADCVRVRRALRCLGVEVDVRNVLLSLRHRAELRRIAGDTRVPCLVIAGTVVREPDEILKYLRLRYGEGSTSSRSRRSAR
jgi:glutathione S-transferase